MAVLMVAASSWRGLVRRVVRSCGCGLAWSLIVLSATSSAFAQTGLLLSEPIDYTDVADAFDGDDVLDIHARIELRSAFVSSTIQREVIDETTLEGSAGGRFADVLNHAAVRNELRLGLEVGVYRDVMVFAVLPIVLSDDEELQLAGGGRCDDEQQERCMALVEPSTAGDPELLFAVPRTLPNKQRSGLPRVDLGAAWGILNQYRGADATWVVRVTLGVPVGRVRAPCLASGDCEPGLADGITSLTLESRWSRRYRYVEPLLGISHRFAWVTSGEERFRAGVRDDAGDVPTTTEAVLGAAVIPWEDRMRHQRFSAEFSARAAYISEGRGYSPLFDALGSSTHSQLATPVGPQAFGGVTHLGAHGRLGIDAMLVMKAARYVRFALGVDLASLTSHLITGTQDCAGGARSTDTSRATACADGRVHPLYRPVIDAPGQRFRVADALIIGLSARAQGQF